MIKRSRLQRSRIVPTMDGPSEIIIHPDCGFEVDEHYQCPLKEKRDADLGLAEESAKKGCAYCILRYVAIKQIWPNSTTTWEAGFHHNHDQPLRHISVHAPANRNIVLTWDNTFRQSEPFLFRFYGQEHSSLAGMERVVPCDTSSMKSLQTARQWIKKCDEEHTCMQATKPLSPRRVLDLRHDCVRLLETTGENVVSRYACLSHCWGTNSENLLRMKSSNLSSFKNEIPFNLLPRTFQDAILFTRQLGVLFLWIDSLCIIQDDVRDWQQQSAVMAEIYQNAYITLAATASDSATKGLYTAKDRIKSPRNDRPPVALVRNADGTEIEIFTRIRFDHTKKCFPLRQRGWAYQERLLSPRVLHFAGDELIWECHDSVDCECGYRRLGGWFSRPKFPQLKNGDLPNVETDDTNAQLPVLWRKIVRNYTILSLTYPTDIFPALSGIVKAIALKTQDEYLAGLWKRTFVQDLLWYYQTGPSVLNINIHPWRAPSWSWAAATTNDMIEFAKFRQNIQAVKTAQVKGVVCQPSGADPTGELEFAHLTLSTKAIPARLMRVDDSKKTTTPQYVLYVDIDSVNPIEGSSITRQVWHGETGYLGLSDPRLASGIPSLDTMIVEIARYMYDEAGDRTNAPETTGSDLRFCMIIARQADREERWVRVGLVVVSEYLPCTTAERKKVMQVAAERNRRILRRLDEVEVQDVTIW
jgi:hypothetical protein